MIGAAIDDLRTRAKKLVQDVWEQNRAASRIVGVIHTVSDNRWHTLRFNDESTAENWFAHVTQDPSGYTYAACFGCRDEYRERPPFIEKIGAK